MSATNIVMTESQLKRAAGRLNTAINDRISNGQSISHAWMIERLSQGFFGKPYGEVRSTLLSSGDASTSVSDGGSSAAPRVMLIEYGSELILTLDGDYVSGSFPGTDLEVPRSAMHTTATNMAATVGSDMGYVELPELLGPEWETDDIISLADTLGYFRYTRPLHELVDGGNLVIFKNCALREALDGDWEDDLVSRLSCGEGWRSVVRFGAVWSPEFNVGFDRYEMFFSLEDLGRAEEFSEGRWRVTESCSGNDFEFTVITEKG